MAKINKQIKQLDAAVRLITDGRKKTSIIVSQSGVMYSTGLDVAAPSGLTLPKGVYQGAELLEACALMKHAADVVISSEQIGESNWNVVLSDPMDTTRRATLQWQDCAPVDAAVPATRWLVDTEQRKAMKASVNLAATLAKEQLRIVRFSPAIGVLSYLSPTIVMQLWDAAWVREGEAIEVATDAVKRALKYRGAPLIAVGASDGKVNFAFDDGAFLRVGRWDESSYADDQLARVFSFSEGDYTWPLDAGSPAADLLAKISNGSSPSETDGTRFFPTFNGAEEEAVPMPLQCAPGKFYPNVIGILAEPADRLQISGPAAFWENARIAFYGPGYRSVTSMSFSPDEARDRGIIEDDE